MNKSEFYLLVEAFVNNKISGSEYYKGLLKIESERKPNPNRRDIFILDFEAKGLCDEPLDFTLTPD